jgi:hypothetical protein
LSGLVTGKIGASNIVLTDDPKMSAWLPLMRETLVLNSMIADRIRTEYLDWYEQSSIDQFIDKYQSMKFDIILGSDIFFQKKG